jgi:hypothetical protein
MYLKGRFQRFFDQHRIVVSSLSGTSGKAGIHDNFTPATPLKRLPPAIVRTGSGKNAHPPARKGVNQIDTPGKKKQDTNDEEKSIGNNLPGIPDDDKNTQ